MHAVSEFPLVNFVSLQAKTENLDRKDPLLHQDFKKIVEDQDMIRCQTGRTTRAKDIKNYHLPPEPLVPLGRQNTTCRTWLRMPIHDIDSTPRLKSRCVILHFVYICFFKHKFSSSDRCERVDEL